MSNTLAHQPRTSSIPLLTAPSFDELPSRCFSGLALRSEGLLHPLPPLAKTRRASCHPSRRATSSSEKVLLTGNRTRADKVLGETSTSIHLRRVPRRHPPARGLRRQDPRGCFNKADSRKKARRQRIHAAAAGSSARARRRSRGGRGGARGRGRPEHEAEEERVPRAHRVPGFSEDKIRVVLNNADSRSCATCSR